MDGPPDPSRMSTFGKDVCEVHTVGIGPAQEPGEGACSRRVYPTSCRAESRPVGQGKATRGIPK